MGNEIVSRDARHRLSCPDGSPAVGVCRVELDEHPVHGVRRPVVGARDDRRVDQLALLLHLALVELRIEEDVCEEAETFREVLPENRQAGLDAGYFGIYAATYDEALDQALEIIDGHMESIVSDPVTDQEMELAKRLCIVMDQTSQQTNWDQGKNAAISELYGLGYDYTDDCPEKIKVVTKKDVQRVAALYLKDPVTVIRRPSEAEHADGE